MESIEARAFKSSSFFSEIAMKSAIPQALGVGEEYLFVSAAGVDDDFSVDEFFDLQGLEEGEEVKSSSSSSSSSSLSLSSQDQVDEGSSFSGGFSGIDVSGFLSAADGLPIPADDMKELELWSHLMDGTLCDDISACPTRNVFAKIGPNVEKQVRYEPEIKPATVEATNFPPQVLTKPRSKRLRTASGAWSSCWLLKAEYSSFLSSSLPESGFVIQQAVQKTVPVLVENKKPIVKNLKRKPAASEDALKLSLINCKRGSPAVPVQQRRCTHCQVQKTPQWRTGPSGPKTLCNACGVRFKSGRLFPEYRPACSPSFSSEIHSNSHRKVLEMRKKKMSETTDPGSVQQFCAVEVEEKDVKRFWIDRY